MSEFFAQSRSHMELACKKVYRFLLEIHVENLALCEVVTHKCSELSEESYVKTSRP